MALPHVVVLSRTYRSVRDTVQRALGAVGQPIPKESAMIKPTRRGARRLLMAGGLGMTIVSAQLATATPAAASPLPTRSCGGDPCLPTPNLPDTGTPIEKVCTATLPDGTVIQAVTFDNGVVSCYVNGALV